MNQIYRELFDEVHASERLKAEVLNMKDELSLRKRRIPQAALIAAVLSIALAGTALAAGLWGRVHIDLIDPDETNMAGNGYHAWAEWERIPLENLSKEALDRFAGLEDGVGGWRFASWTDAEEFLGIDLMNNKVLDALTPTPGSHVSMIGQPASEEYPAMPLHINVWTSYPAEGYRIRQNAWIQIQPPAQAEEGLGELGLGRYDGETFLENYTAANGIEAVIVTVSGPQYEPGGVYDRTSYKAYFVRNSVFFTVSIHVNDTRSASDSVRALAKLKEVLDAYE